MDELRTTFSRFAKRLTGDGENDNDENDDENDAKPPVADGGGTAGPDRFIGPDGEETGVWTRDSGNGGNTAYLVGGLHGDEISSSEAVAHFATAPVEVGRLVVVPRATRVALERTSRTHPDRGDMNREFPPGESCTDGLAAALWADIEREDPDVLIDAHTSTGIYGTRYGGVGQAVFPSPRGKSAARRTVQWFNDRYITPGEVEPDSWDADYKLREGNTLAAGGSHTLARKAGLDLGIPAYNTEITRRRVPVGIRQRWHIALIRKLLEHSAITTF